MLLTLTLLAACGDPALSLEGDATAGAEVYADTCAVCHGANGEGNEGSSSPSSAGPPMTEEVPEKSDEEIVEIIRDGYEEMEPVDLTDQEIADVLAYLRDTFGG